MRQVVNMLFVDGIFQRNVNEGKKKLEKVANPASTRQQMNGVWRMLLAVESVASAPLRADRKFCALSLKLAIKRRVSQLQQANGAKH